MSKLSVTTIDTADTLTPLTIMTGNTATGAAQIKLESSNNDITFTGNLKVGTGQVLQTNKSAIITTGYSVQSFNAGANIAAYGTWQPNSANGNYQYATCNGAVTITTPPANCAIDILFVNAPNRNPGSVTFSGFTVGSQTGTYDTTSGNRFILSIREINSIATYSWYPMQ